MRFTCTFLLVFWATIFFGQEDEVRKQLVLSMDFSKTNIDSSFFYAKKAYSLSQKTNSKELQDSALIMIAQNHYYLGNQDEFEFMLENIRTSIEKNDFTDRTNFYKLDVINKTNEERHREAIKSAKKGIKSIRPNMKKYVKIDFLHSIAISYRKIGDFTKAIEYYDSTLSGATLNQDLQMQQVSFLGKGLVYKQLTRYDDALNAYKKALKIAEQIDNLTAVGDIQNNIGSVYSALEKHKAALEVFRNVKRIREETNDLGIYYGVALNNLALEFLYLNKNDSARYYLDQAFTIYERINDVYGLADIPINYAILSLREGNRKNATIQWEQAKKKAFAIEADDIVLRGYLALSKEYERLNEFEMALDFNKKHQTLNDSLYTNETKNQINELQVAFDTEQKENEILRLSNENNLEKAKSANLRLTTYGITGGFLIFGLVIFFLWNRRKQKHLLAIEQQKIEALQKSINAVENEKQRIGKELHDVIANDLIAFAHQIESNQPVIATKVKMVYDDVRNVSHKLNYYPPITGVFADHLADLIMRTDWSFRFRVHPPDMVLPESIGSHVYRILQELMINTLKHADSPEAGILLNKYENTLDISYEDIGKGTDSFIPGDGHKSIADRIKIMNGNLEIKTEKNKGFKVTIKIPLA